VQVYLSGKYSFIFQDVVVDLKVDSECMYTILDLTVSDELVHIIGDTAVNAGIGASDSVSEKKNGNGYSFCGMRTY